MDGPIALAARVPGAVRVTAGGAAGRERVTFRVDPSHHAGALSEAAGRKIAASAELALKLRRPLVGLVASSGADVFEGVAALHGWGKAARSLAACSGIVPV